MITIKDTVKEIASQIIANKDILTELDRKIGDADHGNNMSLGFNAVLEKIDSWQDSTKYVLEQVGMTLMSTVGGASGPLYGMSFVKGSVAFTDKQTYTYDNFKNFVQIVTETIKELGEAELGYKTMLDVWGNLNNYLAKQKTINKEEAIDMINKFKISTIEMKALKGRASYLGDRSIGHLDPGSASSSIILNILIKGIE